VPSVLYSIYPPVLVQLTHCLLVSTVQINGPPVINDCSFHGKNYQFYFPLAGRAHLISKLTP